MHDRTGNAATRRRGGGDRCSDRSGCCRTLTRGQSHQIDVKQKDNKTFYIKVDKNTLVTHDKKEVPLSELKHGRSVVVQALGDDETDLLALEVRLVPDIKDSGRQ